MAFNITFAAIIAISTVILGVLVKIIGFPHQFYKNYKRKSTKGLSTPYILLSFFAYLLWTIHGIIRKDWTLIIGQGLGIITVGMIVGQIFIYRKKK